MFVRPNQIQINLHGYNLKLIPELIDGFISNPGQGPGWDIVSYDACSSISGSHVFGLITCQNGSVVNNMISLLHHY